MDRTIKLLHDFGIEVIATLAKIGLFLYLPFKFIQLFIEAMKKRSAKKQ